MSPSPKKPYGGYLKPHAEQINRLASEGVGPMPIARVLFAQGALSRFQKLSGLSDEAQIRTVGGLVRHMLGLNKKRQRLSRIDMGCYKGGGYSP